MFHLQNTSTSLRRDPRHTRRPASTTPSNALFPAHLLLPILLQQFLRALGNLLRRRHIGDSSSPYPKLNPPVFGEVPLQPYAEQQKELLMIRVLKSALVD